MSLLYKLEYKNGLEKDPYYEDNSVIHLSEVRFAFNKGEIFSKAVIFRTH